MANVVIATIMSLVFGMERKFVLNINGGNHEFSEQEINDLLSDKVIDSLYYNKENKISLENWNI